MNNEFKRGFILLKVSILLSVPGREVTTRLDKRLEIRHVFLGVTKKTLGSVFIIGFTTNEILIVSGSPKWGTLKGKMVKTMSKNT